MLVQSKKLHKITVAHLKHNKNENTFSKANTN